MPDVTQLFINTMMLDDPSAKRAFQRDLWRFLKGQRPVDVEEHQLELTRFVREAALRRFGSARSAQMKPLISALIWRFLRLIAPVRRSFHAAFDVAMKLEKQGDFVSANGVQSHCMRLRTKMKEFSRRAHSIFPDCGISVSSWRLNRFSHGLVPRPESAQRHADTREALSCPTSCFSKRRTGENNIFKL